jgi:cobalt-zinc-cadmium efflux system membrane fusion protein
MKKSASILVLSFALTSLLACKEAPPASEPTPQAPPELVVAHPKNGADNLEIPAHIMPDPSRVVHVFPPLSGRIFGMQVLPGQEVTKGQTIAMLQSSDIGQARSDYEKAKIEVLRADRALDRGKLLLQHEVLSQADYYELEATDKAAHSELDRTRQRIQLYGLPEDSVADTVPIKAPISGAVLDIGTATGELQRSLDNAATIATIANLDVVWVVGDVFERDLDAVKVGRVVNIAVPAYPNQTFSGRVDNISDAIDPTTHTLKLRVVLNNPGHRLKADMFATIQVPGAARTVFMLPATAIFYEGDKTYVFVQNAQNKLDKREVTVGRTVTADGKKNIEVITGLNDGDKVVAVGSALLRPVSGD